jgi:hypothetical protein
MHCATSPNAPRQAAQSAGYFDSTCKPVSADPPGRDDIMAAFMWRFSFAQARLPAHLDMFGLDQAMGGGLARKSVALRM